MRLLSLENRTPLQRLLMLSAMTSGGSVVEATATGNPLTFQTDLARPLKSLLIPFTPVQSGSGDPSPQNVRPLVPWEGLKVWNGGKNLLNPVAENVIPFSDSNYGHYTLTNGIVVTSGNTLFGFKLKVKPSTKYRFSFNATQTVTMEIFAYTSEPSRIQNNDTQIINFDLTDYSFTTPANCEWISCGIYTTKTDVTISDFMLIAGNTASEYVPYEPITETDIVFPSPVYGGEHEAVSGKLMSFYALLTKNTAEMNNNEDYPGWKNSGVENIIGTGVNELLRNVLTNVSPVSSMSVGANTAYGSDVLYLNKSFFNKTQSEWIALAIDVQILVPLATPQEITLTPEQITALKGDNTIWSDANDDCSVIYYKKG